MNILVVEDEPSLQQSILDFFGRGEVCCEVAASYDEGIAKIEDFQYDCIILDINLPGGSGLDLLHFLRQQKKEDGVIIISARDAVDDRIRGLDLGADDYLVKPFHLSELNARLKALVRRKYGKGSENISFGGLTLNVLSRTAVAAQGEILLTKNEYNLLLFLVTNRNRVVSRQAIAEHLFREEAFTLSSYDFVYSHIKHLKRKLKEKGVDDLIHTVYGLGYKLAV